jgi:flagellar FliL protein
MGAVLPVLVVVLIALASGAGYSLMLDQSGRQRTTEPQAATARAKGLPELSKETVVPIQPLLVSSDGQKRHWIRLEGAIAFRQAPSKDEQPLLIKIIAEDMLSYLRTTPITQLESAAGFEFARDELSEIARVRSNGRASKFILKAMVIE